MKIYPDEIKDGLESYITNNSIAFKCQANKLDISAVKIDKAQINIDKAIAELQKANANIGLGRNFDIYYLSSILASVGSNANDDVFTASEIWAARNTPIYKQFNYGHNEKDIIGCIFDSFVLDAEGSLIDSAEKIDLIKDIGTLSAIWTKWDDEELQSRIDKTIAEIEAGKQFVSMEVLFRNFDYLLIDKTTAEEKIVPRSETTAFLTKHLKSFGGEGSFDRYLLKRVLREFTFSGKGLVYNPANDRSTINPNINIDIDSKKSIANDKKGTYNMSDLLEKQVADLQRELKDSQAAVEKMKEAHAKERESLVSAEIDTLKKEVASLIAQKEELTKLVETNKAAAEKAESEVDKEKEKNKKDMEEAEAKIAALETEKVVASRVNKLVTVGLSEDVAQETVKTWASLNDEQFDEVAELYKKKSEASKDGEDETDKAKADKNEGEDFEDITDKSTANLNNQDDDAEDEFTALAESLRAKLLKNKKDEE